MCQAPARTLLVSSQPRGGPLQARQATRPRAAGTPRRRGTRWHDRPVRRRRLRPRRCSAFPRRPRRRAGTALPATPVASGVGAEAYDFGSFVLRLTRTSVPAGNLTVYFRNYDVSEHNLWLDPPAGSGGSSVMISEALGEGEGATRTVAVTPGTWRLYCSLTGHGVMTRDLAVE